MRHVVLLKETDCPIKEDTLTHLKGQVDLLDETDCPIKEDTLTRDRTRCTTLFIEGGCE